MAVRVAINGFGRIGRNILRAIAESGRTDIEVVGINDLGPVETNAHLLRFDSVHGRFPGTVTVDGDSISLGNGKIKVSAERDPTKLPAEWLSHGPGRGAGEAVDARLIGNFIAGMTDRFALIEHQRLFDSTPDLR